MADLVVRCRPLLGTFVEITVPAGFATEIDTAFAAIGHVHACMSFHEDASDLAAIRRAAPGQTIVVDRETVQVLRVAITLYEATDGLFDVAIGRHLVDWGFLPNAGITSLTQYDGSTADIMIEDDTSIRLSRRMVVDLGGIAKGFAVDRAVEALAERGVPFGLVNAGGDLRAFGPKDWPIGLRDADGVVRSTLPIRQAALASSANLQDQRTSSGIILVPHIGRNGRPVHTNYRVTTIAERCVIADAVTKVAMVDLDLADKLLTDFNGRVLRDAIPLETP
jgi:thiamine biosynthesis lipoprotein